MPRLSRRFRVLSLRRAAPLAMFWLGVDCSGREATSTAPSVDARTYVLRVRRTDGVAGAPQEDSLAFPAGQSVSYAFQPGPGYVSVSVQLDSVSAASNGTIRMSSDHLLAVGATPSITSAPRDSSLAAFLTSITVAGDPRGGALAAAQRIDSLVRAVGSAEAIKSAANAVALAATSPLSLAQRLHADSAMWDVAIPVSLQAQTSPALARAGVRRAGTNLQPAADQVPVDVVYVNAIRLRFEKFLSEIPAFQDIVRGANLPGDLQASAYYSKTSGDDAVNPRSDCDALTWIDALESRTDYVDIARRFGRCIGADAAPAMTTIAKALAPGVASGDAVGATEHATKSLRAGRAVILLGYAQGALVSQEAIRAIKAANDPKLDAGNCVGFVSVASPFHMDDVVAPGLIAGTVVKGAEVKDLMLYMPGPKATGLTNELSTKFDAADAQLSGSPALRSAHEAWSAYHLHDFVESYEGSSLGATFVQSRLKDIANALRERCGLGRELAVASSAVTFTALTGSNPAPATIAVSNAGVATIAELSASVSYAAGQTSGWLTATLSSAATPAMLTLSAAASALSAGTYAATVTLSSGNAAVKNAPLAIPVTLTVASRPVLTIAPPVLSFTAVSGSAPQTQVVRITNSGAGALTDLSVGPVQYAGASGWLTATLDRSSAPANLNVTSTFASLNPGTYSATIPVQTALAGVTGSPKLIAVTATVAQAPTSISLSTTALALASVQGDSAPPPQTIQIANGGSGTLDGLALSAVSYGPGGTAWLSVSLSGTTAPAAITLTAAPGALGPGSYSATFTVASTTPGVSARAITVVLTVSAAAPMLSVSSTAVSFSAAQGSANPSPQTVQVTNSGQGTLTGLSLGTIVYSGVGGWLSASLSGTTAPASVTLSANASSLSPGTYTATVALSSSAANVSGSPRTIVVSLNVAAAPRPIIAFSSFQPLAFSVTSGAACPSTAAPPVFSVSNNGSGTLDGLAVSASYSPGQPSWLSVSLSGTTAPATINAKPSCAAYSLAPGTYTATVSVSSTAAGVTNSPQSLSATLVVSAGSTATTGSLTVSVSGLPAGVSASVVVNSNFYQTTLTFTNGQSTTLTNLFPNDYNVVPYTTSAQLAPGLALFEASPPNQFITVTAGSTASASVTYALASGYLRISATGIPSGCAASYSYAGARQSGSGPLTSAQGVFIAAIPAGTYTVSFGPPQGSPCAGTTLHAANVTVNIPASTAITPATGTYIP